MGLDGRALIAPIRPVTGGAVAVALVFDAVLDTIRRPGLLLTVSVASAVFLSSQSVNEASSGAHARQADGARFGHRKLV